MLLLTKLHHGPGGLPGQLFFCQGAANPWGELEFWKVLVGLTAVMAAVWLVMQITGAFRRKPSLDLEIAALATKSELAAMVKATKEELAEMERRLSHKGDDRERTLSGEIAELRKSLTTQSSNLHTRINHDIDRRNKEAQDLSLSMQAIQRALGRLEAEPPPR